MSRRDAPDDDAPDDGDAEDAVDDPAALVDENPDESDPDESDPDEPDLDEPDPDEPEPDIDPGEVLFYEPGGSWWVVAIGPVLVGAVLILEIAGPGQVHWPVMLIFGAIIFGFSIVQVIAARRHVSVELTETTLRQGTKRIALDDIARVYPANHAGDAQKWESARALGELAGVPRRRKGVGLKMSDGSLAQAWARDVDRFRTELTEAHQAVKLGLTD